MQLCVTTVLCIALMTKIALGQRENIWYYKMNVTSADWTGSLSVISSLGTNCPNLNGKDYCWDANSQSIELIKSAGSGLENYNTIQLTYSLATSAVSVNKLCILEYSIDETTFNDIFRTTGSDIIPSAYNDQSFSIGNPSTLTIRLTASGSNNHCYFNEFTISGIPVTSDPSRTPSSDPTTTPTKNPSTNPSRTPSSDPTTAPTKNPSTNPSRTPSTHPSDPTTTPTKNPSANPSRTPITDPTTQNATMNPTTNPSTSPTAAPTFVVLPSVQASGAATITSFTMSAGGNVMTVSSGESIEFNYDPGVGTTVTVTMTYNWDSRSSANLYCSGCIRQLLFNVDGTSHQCVSYGYGTYYTGRTMAVSYVHDGTFKYINTHSSLSYSCSDVSGVTPNNKLGYIYFELPTTAPTDPPTTAPTEPTSTPSSAPTDDTSSPTKKPTNYPTLTTFDPTLAPSMNPTDSTLLPTMNPSISPTEVPTDSTSSPLPQPTPAPSKAPLPFQPTVAPLNNLYLIIRYTDKSWTAWYSYRFQQESDYTDIMQNALDAAFQLLFAHSIMYSQDDSWNELGVEWTRAGMINVNFCSFSDVVLNDDCISYEESESNDGEEYVAVAVFGAVANKGLVEYVRYLRNAVRDDAFLAAFSEQMNYLLDESAARRRNLLANNFEVFSIRISDPINDIFNTEDASSDDSFLGLEGGSMNTASYVVIAVFILAIVLLVVGCVCCCKKRSERKGTAVFTDDVEIMSSPSDDADDGDNTKL